MTSIPCQDNVNPLYNNYFQFRLKRGTTQLELMVQKVNLPGLTVNEQPQPTIFGTTIPVPTTGIQFEPLSIEFLVDSNLSNWKSIYSWMRNLTNIQDSTSNNIPYSDWHYDASLILPSPLATCEGGTNTVLTIDFFNVIPTRLSGLPFQSDSPDAVQLKATCTFKYSYYTLDPDAPDNLS